MFPNGKGENVLRCKALEKDSNLKSFFFFFFFRASDSLPLSPPQSQLFLAPPCLVQCFTRRNLAGSPKSPFTDEHFSLGNPGRAVFCSSSLTWQDWVISMGKRWIELLVLESPGHLASLSLLPLRATCCFGLGGQEAGKTTG